MEPIQHHRTVHIDLPLIVNSKLDCGPIAVEMVARHFGIVAALERIKSLASPHTDGVTSTIGLARAGAELGMKVMFFSQKLGFDPETFSLPYYRDRGITYDVEQGKFDELAGRCRLLGGQLHEKILSLDEILSQCSRDSIPVVLVDWNVVTAKCNQYEGHFLPIVGFDSEYVYVNHSGPEAPRARMPIKRETLERAHKARGTDADVVFFGRALTSSP